MPTAQATRQVLFFAEQRAGRVGYIGWPPLHCAKNGDCAKIGINGSYCMNDPSKTAPYFCHEPEVFLKTGLDKPVGLSADDSTGEVFYTEDDQAGGDTYHPLSAVSVDGTKSHEVIDKLLDPQGIYADSVNNKVYYTEHHGQRVGVVDMDGKNRKVLHQFTGTDYPSDVKVDAVAGKVFAVVEGALTTGQKLVSMDLDGKNFQVLKNDIVQAYGLTLVPHMKKIYYINGGHGGFIGNMTYEGKDAGKLLDFLDYPYMLDYDPVADSLVFSETGVGDGSLKTINLKTGKVEKSLALGFAPMGVVFGKVPIGANQ
jgi:DNA-binding beta-propeller fold protein YncE